MRSTFIGKVLDNYRILESLGIGGMGVVFKAVNIKLDKLVAIKMIAPGMAMNEKFIRRFQTEAKALAKLADPNIVNIFDLRSDNDQWFIVMEYVNGGNISELIKKNGTFSLDDSVLILKQILNAVGHAHTSGIIHRDLKPNNIMLTKDNVVKITDFGLAKIQTDIINTMTVAGGGTLYYMSPEQVKDFSQTDKRSDIYSIGMTFFEMITGKIPFENINSDFDIRETIVHKELNKPSVYNASIPKALETIIIKSTAKNPDERYQSTDEMLHDILAFESKSTKIDTITEILENTVVVPQKEQDFPKEEEVDTFSKSKKSSFFKYILPAVLLLLLFIFYFLYPQIFKTEPIVNNKSSVNITSSPPKAEVYLNNKEIGKTPINDFLIETGDHTLTITKEGYSAIDTVFSAKKDIDHSFSFLLNSITVKSNTNNQSKKKITTKSGITSPVYPSILFTSDPSGANLIVNKDLKGKTPLRINELPPGKYDLEIVKDGYETISKKIEVKNGQNENISESLTPLTGSLRLTTDPADVSVKIDGKLLEEKSSPINLKNIQVGKHSIEIFKNSYVTYLNKIEIAPKKTSTINITLNRAIGTLSILVKPWGSIYINNQLKKESASFINEYNLPAKQYTVKITHPSLGYWQKKISIRHKKKEKIQVNFNQKFTLNVSAEDKNGSPVYGKIYIDGNDSGQITPKQIELNTGIHFITVKKDGYYTTNGKLELLVTKNLQKPILFILTSDDSNR